MSWLFLGHRAACVRWWLQRPLQEDAGGASELCLLAPISKLPEAGPKKPPESGVFAITGAVLSRQLQAVNTRWVWTPNNHYYVDEQLLFAFYASVQLLWKTRSQRRR